MMLIVFILLIDTTTHFHWLFQVLHHNTNLLVVTFKFVSLLFAINQICSFSKITN